MGWFVIPEQDAQVWVEFEEGELRRPIWVGTFWQKSGDAPPTPRRPRPPRASCRRRPATSSSSTTRTGEEQIRLHHAGGAEHS